MMGTQFTNQPKKLQMLLHFIETDSKLIMTWIGSAGMVIGNMLGFNIQEYELWKIIALDILTALSLMVAMGYTLYRWRRLAKQGKEMKPKRDNTD